MANWKQTRIMLSEDRFRSLVLYKRDILGRHDLSPYPVIGTLESCSAYTAALKRPWLSELPIETSPGVECERGNRMIFDGILAIPSLFAFRFEEIRLLVIIVRSFILPLG
jgi:hypothetical protein